MLFSLCFYPSTAEVHIGERIITVGRIFCDRYLLASGI
jgi:hypothetical protein